MTSDALSIRLDADILNGLGRLVIELNRSREDLIKDAVKKFVDDEIAFSAVIEAGERDFENGDYVTHEECMAEFGHKDVA